MYGPGKGQMKGKDKDGKQGKGMDTTQYTGKGKEVAAKGKQSKGRPPYKSTLCKYWLQNRCNKGAQCTFAHGKDELTNTGQRGKPGPSPLPPPRQPGWSTGEAAWPSVSAEEAAGGGVGAGG